MDHAWIDGHGVAEEYVLGRLDPAREVEFEEHLIGCHECRERVRWAEELQDGLRTMAAGDRQRTTAVHRLVWSRDRTRGMVLPGTGRAARLMLAAALLVALVLPAALLFDELRLRRSLAAAHAAAARESELAAARPAPGAAHYQSAPELRQRDERLSQQDGELARERQRANDLAARLADLLRPQANPAVFSLGLVRGEGRVQELRLGPQPAWIELSIELPAPPDATGSGSAWRAALLDARGRSLWSGRQLRPTASDTLVLGLHSSLLSPGSYLLVLDGPAEAPQRTEIPFRVASMTSAR